MNLGDATEIIFIKKLQLGIKSEAALGGQTMFKKYVDLCRFVDFSFHKRWCQAVPQRARSRKKDLIMNVVRDL